MFSLAFSCCAYLGFVLVFGYFAAFADGVLVPKHVDSGQGAGTPAAFFVDFGLMLLFGLTHSIMARPHFKQAVTRVVPPALERSTYVVVATAALALLMWQWRPLPSLVWRVERPSLVAALWLGNGVSWAAAGIATFLIDHFELFGVNQALAGFRRASLERRGFITPLFYKYVRHPMMTALLLAFWLAPRMSVGHLLLALGMSAYILIGVHFEERSLLRELGHAYVQYQRSTPKFLPFFGRAPAAERADGSPGRR